MRRFGLPRHLVTDQGSQFTAICFRDALTHAGIRQRFGAIGKVGSIALIERFWRTLKHSLALKSFKPLVLDELEKRVALGPERAHLQATPPPRGLSGAGPAESQFDIVYLDPERSPFLLNTAA